MRGVLMVGDAITTPLSVKKKIVSPVRGVFMVGNGGALDIREHAPGGLQQGLGRAGVPLLAARGGEHVGVGLAGKEEQHLMGILHT